MWLHEHPDFDQLLLRTAESLRPRNLSASAIEKDYFVTEVLRALVEAAPGRLLFKGGTSLSKGWGLIERFSEDVDIFLDPDASQPPLRRKGIDREARRLRDAAARIPGLRHIEGDSRTFGGVGRSDAFEYRSVLAGPAIVAPRVLLEVGTSSGREPSVTRSIQSFVSQFLMERDLGMGTVNERAFSMRLLHFRRTFLEKLFAIHSKVELIRERGGKLGPYARHYYDLYQLAGTPEVQAMLRSGEADVLRADYDRVSRARFARDYRPPEGLRFASSSALFPDGELEPELRGEYEAQARLLCFGRFPDWGEVRARLELLRELL